MAEAVERMAATPMRTKPACPRNGLAACAKAYSLYFWMLSKDRLAVATNATTT
ncbi:hypothetical protein D1872_344210 [compost metagenome]